MEMTLLERAAEVRERRAALERTCQELRQLKGDWTAHAIAADEAMKIADDGMRNAWAMLDRLNQLAKAEIGRMATPNAGVTGAELAKRPR
jgi:hypothetical protein